MIISTDLEQTKVLSMCYFINVNVQTLDAIQNKQQTALLLMDIRKAFDTVVFRGQLVVVSWPGSGHGTFWKYHGACLKKVPSVPVGTIFKKYKVM